MSEATKDLSYKERDFHCGYETMDYFGSTFVLDTKKYSNPKC